MSKEEEREVVPPLWEYHHDCFHVTAEERIMKDDTRNVLVHAQIQVRKGETMGGILSMQVKTCLDTVLAKFLTKFTNKDGCVNDLVHVTYAEWKAKDWGLCLESRTDPVPPEVYLLKYEPLASIYTASEDEDTRCIRVLSCRDGYVGYHPCWHKGTLTATAATHMHMYLAFVEYDNDVGDGHVLRALNFKPR